MRPSLCSFTLAASMLLLLNSSTVHSDPLPWPNIAKRDNTVYVTVTEYRYVPQSQPSAAPLALNPQPQPASLAQPIDRQVPVSAVLVASPASNRQPQPVSMAPYAERPAPSNVHPNPIFPAPLAPPFIPLPRPNTNPMLIAPPSILPPAFAPATPRPYPNPPPAAPMAPLHPAVLNVAAASPIDPPASLNRAAPVPVASFPPATSQPNTNPMAMVPAIPLGFVSSVGHLPPPAPIASPVNNVPAPIVAAWTPPANDALTYTSYAGLLSTMAPAFYPTPLNSAVPSHAIVSSMPQQQQSPPPPSPIAHSPTPLTVPLTPASAPTPSVSSNALSIAHSDSTSSVDSAISNHDTAALTSTSTSSSTSTSTTATTDVTVSTTTTTRGDTASTKAMVGTDSTTTVLTEYPTSTRSRGSQSTSGAQARWPCMQARQDPSVGSIFGYLTGRLIPETRWSMTATAMIAALALPGAAALVA